MSQTLMSCFGFLWARALLGHRSFAQTYSLSMERCPAPFAELKPLYLPASSLSQGTPLVLSATPNYLSFQVLTKVAVSHLFV